MATDIMEYEGLVYNISKKFYGTDREDLIQAGFLGLTKASKNYKPEYGVKFSTYAYEYIYGEMYETANGFRPIKLQKSSLKIYKDLNRTKELLTQKYGREVSISEAAAYLKIPNDLLGDILSSLSATLSIENVERGLSRKDNLDDMILLSESLSSLNEIEKSVIKKRYMEDMSQDETAKKLGLSQVKVSRIEKKSKEKMKHFITS